MKKGAGGEEDIEGGAEEREKESDGGQVAEEIEHLRLGGS